MVGFVKRCFFTGLAFSSTLTSINLLNCISMKNQGCKVRPQIVSVSIEGSIFFSLVLKQTNAVVVATISVIHTQSSVFLML